MHLKRLESIANVVNACEVSSYDKINLETEFYELKLAECEKIIEKYLAIKTKTILVGQINILGDLDENNSPVLSRCATFFDNRDSFLEHIKSNTEYFSKIENGFVYFLHNIKKT